ncbi:MAG TPA: TadE/TadG family type IV pilus assembly protein [Streptosporangiaceae bacterium]|nr:TadE/TadG family type IV pilus assembly protein [Streptosporangiaceae bacterium]
MRPGSAPRAARAGRDRGTMALELAIMAPVLVAFMVLMVGVGRIVNAQSQVDSAARDAVRNASVARSAGEAQDRASVAARASLQGHTWCQGGPSTATDTSAWAPGGRVSVTVSCDADLGGLSLVGLPGSKHMTGRATAPLDTFRRAGP